MIKKLLVVLLLAPVVLAGYACHANSGSSAQSVSGDESVSDDKSCRTFGFRDWSLQRGEGTVSISAEANMPSPAWTVVLHNRSTANDAIVQLVVETIEPTGFSSAVVSWVAFNTTVETDASASAEVVVSCADETVWST